MGGRLEHGSQVREGWQPGPTASATSPIILKLSQALCSSRNALLTHATYRTLAAQTSFSPLAPLTQTLREEPDGCQRLISTRLDSQADTPTSLRILWTPVHTHSSPQRSSPHSLAPQRHRPWDTVLPKSGDQMLTQQTGQLQGSKAWKLSRDTGSDKHRH